MNETLRFVFFPVGQGSCVLVSFPSGNQDGTREYGIIDSNDLFARPVRHYLSKPWFPNEPPADGPPWNIKFVVSTHYHKDHITGIDYLLGKDDDFICDKFLCTFPPPGFASKSMTDSYLKDLFDSIDMLVHSNSIKEEFLIIDRIYNVHQDANFEFMALAPADESIDKRWEHLSTDNKKNIMSSAIKMRWGKSVILIGGDVETDQWNNIIEHYAETDRLKLLQSNLVLAPHHGGHGNPDTLWEHVSRCSGLNNPQRRGSINERIQTFVVISCGSGNPSIPRMETLATYKKHKVSVSCTHPNWSCTNHHKSNRKTESPCYYDSNSTGDEFKLPSVVKPERISINLPSGIQRIEKRGYGDRSICVDVYFKDKKPHYYRYDGSSLVDHICGNPF